MNINDFDFNNNQEIKKDQKSTIILEQENNKDQNSTILNQHSALITFKIEKGRYFKVPIEKIIFALLLNAQKQLKISYRETYINIISKITTQTLEDFLKNLYNNDFDIDVEKLNQTELAKVAFEINKTIASDIKDRTSISSEQKELFDSAVSNKKINKLFYNPKALELKNQDIEPVKITQIEAKQIIQEIKDHCKLVALRNNLNFKTVNLTILANSIKSNITELKAGIKEAVKTHLSFNYINKKNLNVEVTTNILASARITKREKNTELTYQIPREILDLLILPEVYVPLDEVVVDKIQGNYTFRMYSLLNDHLKRGEIEITKEEVFTFFDLPKSYSNKTNLLKKFIEPVLKEVKEVSGIETDYEFIPSYSWRTIKFYPKKLKTIKAVAPVVVENSDDLKDIYSSDNVLKYVDKSKRNIYIQKAWKKTVDNKLNKILNTYGEDLTIDILKAMYELKSPIETTLVQYINGILKNFKEEKKKDKSLPSKEKVTKTIKAKEIKKEAKKTTLTNSNLNLFNLDDKIVSLEPKDELKGEFENLEDNKKIEVEKEAVKLCAEDEKISPEFLFTMKRNSPSIYFNTIRKYIEKTMKK
jgi:hypothetical protein